MEHWHRRCAVRPALLVAIVVAMATVPAWLAAGDDYPPIQITDLQTPVERATFVVQTLFDSTNGIEDVYHAAWTVAGKLYYRSGVITSLARPRQLVTGLQACAEPLLFMLPSGKPGLVWAEERTPNLSIVPGEWNLRYTADVNVAPRWFTEDAGIGGVHPDRNPSVAVQGDTVLVAWERDEPPQVAYAFLSPRDIFPLVRLLTSYPYGVSRPTVAADTEGAYWIAWTAETPTGGDVWVARVSRNGATSASPVRAGPEDARNCVIAVNADRETYVAWQEGLSGGSIYLVRALANGRFTPAVKVSPEGTVCATPQLCFESGTIPCVSWRNVLTGDLEMVRVYGTRPMGPVNLVSGVYTPRQEFVTPAQLRSRSGCVVSAFLGPDPVRGVTNLWISRGKEYTPGADSDSNGGNKPAAPSPFFTRVSPNPFNGSVLLEAHIPASVAWRLEIRSIDGRLVRKFEGSSVAPGPVRVVWDGGDSFGQTLGSGTYLVRWSVGLPNGEMWTHTERVTLVR
ncbi:MAG TPA: hypothetical protein PK384_01005 [Candidatus Latescibacteria bacterium]|mgnify:FL=1|nr:hypothetical protein [Candidatus Latescibacterota bacterium]